MNSDDAVDAQLLCRIAERNQQAFENLYYRYHPRVARFIYRLTGQTDGLDEIVNDTLYVVWRKAASFNGSAKPSTWIFGIAYRKTLKALKAQYRQQPAFDSDLLETVEDTYRDGARSDSERLEDENWFSSAFFRLPPEQRATVELTYYHDLSYREIAALMRCSENTVKTRMFHARKKLQSLLPRLAEPAATDSETREES
ncbi:MAG: RNA polymerase sigma factor [Gammaproteobacteria bacterium]